MATTGIPMRQPVASVGYQELDARPGYNQRYSASGGAVTGIIQVVCGVLVAIFGIAALTLRLTFHTIATGLWAGIGFFVVTGVLGILSAKRRSGVIVGYMVMSILSSIVAFFACWTYLGGVLGSISVCQALEVESSFDESFNIPNTDTGSLDVNYNILHEETHEDPYNVISTVFQCEPNMRTVDIAINSLLTLVFFIEFIVSIVGSGFTCCGVCCGAPQTASSTHMTVVTNVPNAPQQGGWPANQGYAVAPQGYAVAPQGYAVASPQYVVQTQQTPKI